MATTPATRVDFWQSKFASNVERDRIVKAKLLTSGWRVATIWECSLRQPDRIEPIVEQLVDWLCSHSQALEFGERSI